ncbi:hypothetical protein, partial [Candidatus Synechococcus spongiarum]|uniref:hypothetical protein n=1 Tax=Candidatus Synechococcus spongiarum TaxID=431041 RepID=UPI001C594087
VMLSTNSMRSWRNCFNNRLPVEDGSALPKPCPAGKGKQHQGESVQPGSRLAGHRYNRLSSNCSNSSTMTKQEEMRLACSPPDFFYGLRLFREVIPPANPPEA